MFDYEKFEVYKKAKAFFTEISGFNENDKKMNSRVADQLYRAALSIPLNIAEGAGRYSKPDKRNYSALEEVSNSSINYRLCKSFFLLP